MSKELKFPAGGRPERDAELAALLAPLYAPPAEEAYWDGLQDRIMARVGAGAGGGGGAGEWWHVLHRWSRAGLAAAAVLAALAGTAWLNHRAAEARMAYDAVLAEPPIYSMELAPEAGSSGSRAP